MTQRNCQFDFPFFKKSKLVARFTGGDVTSDSGLLAIREFDERIAFTEKLSASVHDSRDRSRVEHPMVDLVRQRVYQIIAGYEDCNDATRLRHDPVFKLIAGRTPSSDPLASQPTLSRLENSHSGLQTSSLIETMIDLFIATRPKPLRRITLEIDPTDAITYGHQQLTFFHAFYDQHIYFPLVLCDADSGFVLAPLLRAGNAAPHESALILLRLVVAKLTAAWPSIRIDFRADSSLCVPELLDWLEEQEIPYAIGIGPNPVLKRLSADFVRRVEEEFKSSGRDQRAFTSFRYQTLRTWPHARRVLVKCEVTSMGTNVRYVVVSRRGPSAELYDWYVQRGGTIEHCIEQLKNGFHADRMSCSAFNANQFRLLLHTAAYNLLVLFREQCALPELRSLTINSIRIRLIKLGAVVCQTARRVWINLSESWPFRSLFQRAHAAVTALSP